MRNFEVVQGLSDFTKIWDVFLVPIISSGIICLFTYFLFGKEFFCDIYRKYGLVKISNKYYKQKYIKVGKEKRIILLPVSKILENIIPYLQNPIVIVAFLLMASYILYQIISIVSSFYLLKYFYTSSKMLLYSVSKGTLAEVWTYFPGDSIENLNIRINALGEECSYQKYTDYTGILLVGDVCKFCLLLCVVKFWINRKNIKEHLKTAILLFMCLSGIILSFYLQFQKQCDVLEQKTYYVRDKLVTDNSVAQIDMNKYQISYENIENELRYVDNKMFYGAFGIEICIGKSFRRYMTF